MKLDPEEDRPITRDDLAVVFGEAEKPSNAFRIGAEAEKFGVDEATGAPVPYEGSRGIQGIFELLVERHGWTPESELEGGPIISLSRGAESITLEPGAQLELSGAPLPDAHAVTAEMNAHVEELCGVSGELGIEWLGVGFHPIARQEDLPWVPKQRYGVMKRYLPERGARGLDMMRRTATVQANFDYSSEEDAMQKLCVLLRLGPIVHAMTANAPFIEGRVSQRKSERGDVWLHMDPARSGLISKLWSAARLRYEDYVEWALDAGMFLFRRGNDFIHNTGQTFRGFLRDGYQGHRATLGDWTLHLNTLFPEARLKRTLEARSCDSLPLELACSIPALFTGLLYDAESLARATELGSSFCLEDMESARPELVTNALDASIGGRPVRPIAEQILDLAAAGLERRARRSPDGKDESVYLAPLAALVQKGKCPADVLREGLQPGAQVPIAELVRRTRLYG